MGAPRGNFKCVSVVVLALYTEKNIALSCRAIAIVGGMYETIADFCAPCGVCRQVLDEFCDKDFRLVLGNLDNIKTYTFEEILPFSFGKADLE